MTAPDQLEDSMFVGGQEAPARTGRENLDHPRGEGQSCYQRAISHQDQQYFALQVAPAAESTS